MATVIEFARRWLGITAVDDRLRLLEGKLRTLELEVDRAERARRDALTAVSAARYADKPEDALSRLLAAFRGWR